MAASSPWRLVRFVERLEAWIALEAPDQDTRVTVATWIFTRVEDPYRGVRRAAGFPTLWYGAVPGTDLGDATVQCAYWIEESTGTVICDSFATLSRPI